MSTLPVVASIVTSVKVTEVTPETFKASVPDAESRVIVPPLPPNMTLWLGSSWLGLLAPCTRSEVTPENACAEKPVPLTEMLDPDGMMKAWSLAAERLTSSTPELKDAVTLRSVRRSSSWITRGRGFRRGRLAWRLEGVSTKFADLDPRGQFHLRAMGATPWCDDRERADRLRAFRRRGEKCQRQGGKFWSEPAVLSYGGRVQLDAVARTQRGAKAAPDAISLAENDRKTSPSFSEIAITGNHAAVVLALAEVGSHQVE